MNDRLAEMGELHTVTDVISISHCGHSGTRKNVKIIAVADSNTDPNYQITASACVQYSDVADLIPISRGIPDR